MVKIDIDFARPEYGDEEREAVNRVLTRDWLASGVENEAFEKEFAELIGAKYAVCVNSGSSANLLALAALDLPKGSKVLTSGCGFPATLSPILHLGLEPVLVDYDLKMQNINIDQAMAKLQGVDAVIFAHTMGIPVDIGELMDVAHELGIPVIQDCCEALGATYSNEQVGAWGIGTYSFYPSHQLTALGGGGMVTTSDKKIYSRLLSLRDWGKRAQGMGEHGVQYDTVIDGIPYFAHYTYETIGFNMKLPEANAAFGREQLKRLPDVVSKRKYNWERLHDLINKEPFIQVDIPKLAEPSYFGYTLVLKKPGIRDKFSKLLAERGIRHRPFFAGNITRHDPFQQFKQDFPVADKLMKDSLFVGCWPGISEAELEYMAESIDQCYWMAKND